MSFSDRRKEVLERRSEESLGSTLQLCAEANEVAQRTAEHLSQQTEQLYRIKRDTEEIEHNLNTSGYLLDGMKSWWGSFTQLFTNPPQRQPSLQDVAGTTKHDVAGTARHDVAGTAVKRSTNLYNGDTDNTNTFQFKSDFDQRIEKDLDNLGGMLGELHARAVEMNCSIQFQNELLNEVHTNVDQNNARMTHQRKEISSLMRR